MLLCNRCRVPISGNLMVATVQMRTPKYGAHKVYYHWTCRPTGCTSRRKCTTILKELEGKCEPIYHRSGKEVYGGSERSRGGHRRRDASIARPPRGPKT